MNKFSSMVGERNKCVLVNSCWDLPVVLFDGCNFCNTFAILSELGTVQAAA